MQDIGRVEVETMSLDDVAHGLKSDVEYMRMMASLMRDDIASLGSYWESAEYDAFAEGSLEDGEHLSRSLDALFDFVLALGQTANFYGELEQRLGDTAASLQKEG